MLLYCNFFKNGVGIRKLIIFSSITGFIFSIAGYLIAIGLDCPPSSVIALLAGITFACTRIFANICKLKIKTN